MMQRLVSTLIVLAFFVSGCDSPVNVEESLRRAETAAEAGDNASAVIEAKTALQEEPSNPGARLLLGKVLLANGDVAGAQKELERARSLGASDNEVVPPLARAQLAQADFGEVLAHEPADLNPDSRVDLLASQAAALTAQRWLEEAELKIEEGMAIAPESSALRTEQSRVTLAREDTTAAAAALDEVLLDSPDYAPALTLRGDIAFRENHLSAAEGFYSKAIEATGDNSFDYMKRATVRAFADNYEGALNDLRVVEKTYPNYYELHYLRGMIGIEVGDEALARRALERAYALNRAHAPTQWYLGSLELNAGNLQRAGNLLEQFHLSDPNFEQGRIKLAQLRFQQGDYAGAEELLTPMLNKYNDNPDILARLGDTLMMQGKPAEAAIKFRQVVTLKPESGYEYLRLGSALMVLQDPEAEASLLKARELAPNNQRVHELLIRHYNSQDRLPEAEAAARVFVDVYPDSHVAYNYLATALDRSGGEQQAAAAWRKALEFDPDNIAANHSLAAYAIQAGELEDAERFYLAVLAGDPAALTTHLRLAELAGRRGDETAREGYLEKAVAAHPEDLVPRMALASYFFERGEYRRVEPTLGEMLQDESSDAAMKLLVGRTRLAMGEFERAVAILGELAAMEPDAAFAHYLYSRALDGAGEAAAARRELLKAAQLGPDNVQIRLVTGRLYEAEGKLEEALGELEALKRLAPDNPEVLFLEASLALANDEPDKGLALLRELYDSSPTSRTMRYLARHEWLAGNVEQSIELQENWLNDHPDDLEARLTLAVAYAQSNDKPRALAMYDSVLQRDAENIMALNNSAMILKFEDPDRALELAERASALDPESGLLLDTVAQVRLEQGKVEEARRVSNQALAKNPDSPTLRFQNARIHAQAGDTVAAARSLRSLLRSDAVFAEREEAEQLLRRLETGEG
jgi:putative PEP-CTERM system TPR-repeat lipoprotein